MEWRLEIKLKLLWTLSMAAICAPAWAAMPPAEQNALVKRYCAVCHTDAARNGGLSLEHYDAAKREPGLAAMVLTKLNSGAMGAAGQGVPDAAAQKAWLESTKEQAAGAGDWFVNRDNGVMSASIVREVPPRKPGVADRPLYRLAVACNPSTRAGEMELTWSPQPQTERTLTVSVDGNAPVEFKLEGRESMGNGATVQSGRASVVLGTKLGLPSRSLRVREVFPGEVVEFPFADLDQKARSELHACF